MPAYDYRCMDCNELTEAVHPMAERPAVACQYCGGVTHRIIMQFPHAKFDWKAYDTEDDGMRMVLHPARQGTASPASQIAGGRV